MSEYNLSNDVLTSIRAHSGISNCPSEAIEHVWNEAQKIASERGTSIEFIAADLIRALWAKANMEHRQAGKAGQPLDFQAYCRELLSKKDSLWKKLLGRKQSVAQAQADVAAYEAEIESTRSSLAAAQQKVIELKSDIESTQRELCNHDESAVSESIEEAAKVWHVRHKTAQSSSIVESAIAHAVEAEVVNRVLNVRLIQLREEWSKHEQLVDSFKKQLKDLEKAA
jgi:chromosome segregation ATPase